MHAHIVRLRGAREEARAGADSLRVCVGYITDIPRGIRIIQERNPLGIQIEGEGSAYVGLGPSMR